MKLIVIKALDSSVSCCECLLTLSGFISS